MGQAVLGGQLAVIVDEVIKDGRAEDGLRGAGSGSGGPGGAWRLFLGRFPPPSPPNLGVEEDDAFLGDEEVDAAGLAAPPLLQLRALRAEDESPGGAQGWEPAHSCPTGSPTDPSRALQVLSLPACCPQSIPVPPSPPPRPPLPPSPSQSPPVPRVLLGLVGCQQGHEGGFPGALQPQHPHHQDVGLVQQELFRTGTEAQWVPVGSWGVRGGGKGAKGAALCRTSMALSHQFICSSTSLMLLFIFSGAASRA